MAERLATGCLQSMAFLQRCRAGGNTRSSCRSVALVSRVVPARCLGQQHGTTPCSFSTIATGIHVQAVSEWVQHRAWAVAAIAGGCVAFTIAGSKSMERPTVTAVPAKCEQRGGGSKCSSVADIGELYQLPEPCVWSYASARQLWEQYGVNFSGDSRSVHGGRATASRREIAAQPASAYRPLGPQDEDRIRDMRGLPVGADRNPGVRVEPNFISEEEEERLAKEIRDIVHSHGAIMGGARAYAEAGSSNQNTLPPRLVLLDDGRIVPDPEGTPGPMWRVTGRSEGGDAQRLPPWDYGATLDPNKLPEELKKVAARISALEGYSVGPLRDVTINLRTSSVCRLDPHVDPLGDGANCFVLTLLSGTVLTFSPVDALRENAARASSPEIFGMRSYTDRDLDCLSRRRALCHFAGDARYRWAHSIRPGLAVELRDASGAPRARICDWWGTREQLMERKEERMSVVFAFADPFR